MPIRSGKDKQGTFYRWGTTGKKFYFDPESEISKGRALSRAKKQEAAIYAAGYKGDSKMKLIKVVKTARFVKKVDGWVPGAWKKFNSVIVQIDYNQDKKLIRVSLGFSISSRAGRGISDSIRDAQSLVQDLESAKSWIDKTTADYQKNGWTLE